MKVEGKGACCIERMDARGMEGSGAGSRARFECSGSRERCEGVAFRVQRCEGVVFRVQGSGKGVRVQCSGFRAGSMSLPPHLLHGEKRGLGIDYFWSRV